MKHNTVVVNLVAGPGAGKTTCAWEIAAELKKAGLVVEYVPEVAKEYVWEGRTDLLDGTLEHQRQLYEKQNHRVQCLMGKVDVVVTDSPIILSLLYLKERNSAFENEVIRQFKSQQNFTLFVQRGAHFEKEGRIHDREQSARLDKKVLDLLNDNNIYYGKYTYDAMKICVKNIQTNVRKQRAKNKPLIK
ncbi:MAG: AAA family ATPase [Candidatus Fimenecus sp.]